MNLDQDISEIEIAPLCKIDLTKNKNLVGVWTYPEAFYSYLLRFDSVDVCTYTVGNSLRLPNINRLIIGSGGLHNGVCYRKKKVFGNVHAKIFLGYDGRSTLSEAFVGSLNLTNGTLIEVMCKVNKQQAVVLKRFFDQIWEG